MPNIIEGIQRESNRLRDELIPRYEEIGVAGTFGVRMMKMAITEGEQAIASGDVVRMVRAFKELEDFKE